MDFFCSFIWWLQFKFGDIECLNISCSMCREFIWSLCIKSNKIIPLGISTILLCFATDFHRRIIINGFTCIRQNWDAIVFNYATSIALMKRTECTAMQSKRVMAFDIVLELIGMIFNLSYYLCILSSAFSRI